MQIKMKMIMIMIDQILISNNLVMKKESEMDMERELISSLSDLIKIEKENCILEEEFSLLRLKVLYMK